MHLDQQFNLITTQNINLAQWRQLEQFKINRMNFQFKINNITPRLSSSSLLQKKLHKIIKMEEKSSVWKFASSIFML